MTMCWAIVALPFRELELTGLLLTPAPAHALGRGGRLEDLCIDRGLPTNAATHKQMSNGTSRATTNVYTALGQGQSLPQTA
eukprot:3836284-Alexandrium_andersonii.AAC.1